MPNPAIWPQRLHPVQRRFLAEDLVRLRRSDEQRRYASPHRAAKIDPNPHQIDAVIFALARLPEGGCILADEVGLGKTIETGLVIAQLFAEGASRVLLVAPKALLGQWRQELFTLFEIESTEATSTPQAFEGTGVFLVGREQLGTERGSAAILGAAPFDLCVVDEAHEVFAGLYRRFDRHGQYKDDSKQARTAGKLLDLLETTRIPALLLTATPMQNSLPELWALVRYIDPLGTLLGDLPTFRDVFCGVDDRHLADGQDDELKTRLKVVVQRTLRRQAQEFLEKPFVDREARLFEYDMSADERALYDDVSRYLLEPDIQAFRGRQRQLLLLGFHRRMASSTRALRASLERVATRLRQKLGHEIIDDEADACFVERDLEQAEVAGDPDETSDEDGQLAAAESDRLRAELARVEGFVERATRLGADDAKFVALLQALRFVREQAERGKGAGKLVIFTESLTTQEYLCDRLVEGCHLRDDEVTLFRGNNDSARAREALVSWRAQAPPGQAGINDADIAVRLALVHEFKTRSRVFISTEAGAKGLNLQFCDALVNYDLPWNPQRIEQRIGRCHRYGQTHSVTVVNFLARDNEAQRLTFEILSQKLELFGTVLDASDKVLHHGDGSVGGVLAGALGANIEEELRRIYERSRTLEEVTEALRSLRAKVDEERRRFEETHSRTAQLIEQHLDEEVQQVFRSLQNELPGALADLDRDLLTIVRDYLEVRGAPYRLESKDGGQLLTVASSTGSGVEPSVVAVGAVPDVGSLHMRHPLVVAAIVAAREARADVRNLMLCPDVAREPELAQLRGRRGRLRLVKARFEGFERVERLLPVVVLEGNPVALSTELSTKLLQSAWRPWSDISPSKVALEDLDDAVDDAVDGARRLLDARERERYERACRQAQRFLEDRMLTQRKRRAELASRLELARQRRDGAVGATARADAERVMMELDVQLGEVDAAMASLEQRENPTFRRFSDGIDARRFRPPIVETLLEVEVVVS